jgi:hypothetical protein
LILAVPCLPTDRLHGTQRIMKQEKIVKIIIFFIIVIVGFISIKYAFQENPLSNIPGISLPPMPSIDLGIISYENKNLGIKFSYPDEILKLTESESNINLKSQYFTDADMSGIPGNEKIHYFGFDVSLKKLSIFETIKQELPSIVDIVFPNDKLEDFQNGEGFTEKITIAEKESYAVLQGIEGVNIQYIFIPKNDNETILMQFMYIGDFLNPEISETEQKAIFEFIATTLEFI